MRLSEDPTAQLDPKHLNSPRQRIEFRSPGEVEGEDTHSSLLLINRVILNNNFQTGLPGCTPGVPTILQHSVRLNI